MIIGACTVHISLPGIASLKDKRHTLKPLLHSLRQEFEVAAAEIGEQDRWQSAVLAIVIVANEDAQVYRVLERAIRWMGTEFPNVDLLDWDIELR